MLTIQDLTKRYDDEPAVDGLSLTVERGEFVTLLGPSGCGKTTTLLAVAGHVTPTEGRIEIDGTDVTDRPPEERSLGVVFQRDALFPHMTVRENVAYALGPHDREDTARERRQRIDEYLSLVNLSRHAEKYPDQLSGGQRRRVELARALVYEPDVLLLDEPLTGLDRRLRRELRSEIARIHAETPVTTIFVTHDQADALTLSDQIVVLESGRVVGSGSPRDLYDRPPNPFVASFLGRVSRLPATVVGTDPMATTDAGSGADRTTVEWCGYRFALEGPLEVEVSIGKELPLYLRPDAVESSLDGDLSRFDVTVEGRIVDLTHDGPQSTLEVSVEPPGRNGENTRVAATADGFPNVRPGDAIEIGFDCDSLFAFSGAREPTGVRAQQLSVSKRAETTTRETTSQDNG